jgi:hypothetical protein
MAGSYEHDKERSDVINPGKTPNLLNGLSKKDSASWN